MSRDRDWKKVVAELRRQGNYSQEALAELLKTSQCTVSRWERGITRPNFRMREKLMALAAPEKVASGSKTGLVAAIARELFSCSCLPSMLLDRQGVIIAITTGNEYHPGLSYTPGLRLVDQTEPEDMESVRRLEAFFEETGFWDTVNASFRFPYVSYGEERCVLLTSVRIFDQTYCLMEKFVIDGDTSRETA